MDGSSWLTHEHTLIAFYIQARPREGETEFMEQYALKLPLLTPQLIQFEFRGNNRNF